MMLRPASLRIIGWLMVAGALLGVMPTRASARLIDSDLHFTLDLPPGFVRAPRFIGIKPQIVHAFSRGNDPTPGRSILLLISKMGGTIGRERMTMDKLPPGSKGRLFTTQWSGFEVDGFEVPETVGGIPVLTYNVQVPLKQQAIQVQVFGPASRRAELNAILNATLAGLEGESNWLAAGVASGLDEGSYRAVLLIVAIVGVVGGLVLLWLMGRHSPKGTVVAIAIFLYLCGGGMQSLQVREARLVSGMCKMLGVGGFFIGVAQYTRKSKPDPNVWIIEGSPSW